MTCVRPLSVIDYDLLLTVIDYDLLAEQIFSAHEMTMLGISKLSKALESS